MADAKIKKGAKVAYKSPRGARAGTGKIVDIIESARGLWYSVKDDATTAVIKLRAANLSLA